MLIIDLAYFWLKISSRFDRFRRSPVQSCGVQRIPQWPARSTHNSTDGLRIIRVAEDFGWALDDATVRSDFAELAQAVEAMRVCSQMGRAGRCFPGCDFEVNGG